jgi:hypothetical protein
MAVWRLVVCLLGLLLGGKVALGQTVPVTGNLGVSGHINACITGPTATTGNAYACTLGFALTAVVPKACYSFVADSDNTGAATINYSGTGAKNIVKTSGGITTPLVASDIRAGQIVTTCYDGTNMQCQNCTTLGAATAPSQLLGRGSAAGGGEWQPIILGPGLAMSGSTLSGWVPGSPLRSHYFPASSMAVSGGCVLNAAGALVTNGPRLVTISCTDAATDSLDFDTVLPSTWDGGAVTVTLHAFSTGANSGEVFAMTFAGQCVSDGASVVAHSATGAQLASLTWGASAAREQQATTPALTLNGTCGGGAHVYLHGQVEDTSTTLTPMTDLKILGVTLGYGTTTAE